MDAKKHNSTIPKKMTELAREFEACQPAFIALGDESRQRIVIALLEQGGALRVGEITECINLSRPAVSHHLKILREAGIVNRYKRGTMNFYHIDPNRSQWNQLAALVFRVQDLINEVSDGSNLEKRCPFTGKLVTRD